MFGHLFATAWRSAPQPFFRPGNPVLHNMFNRFHIKGKSLLPVVQGGMGVGVSAHRLAGTVAALDALGTISSVDLRRHHPDLMAQTGKSREQGADQRRQSVALDREIGAAKKSAAARA